MDSLKQSVINLLNEGKKQFEIMKELNTTKYYVQGIRRNMVMNFTQHENIVDTNETFDYKKHGYAYFPPDRDSDANQ